MILADLRGYLRGHPGATLAELAQNVGADPEALKGMLEVWIRKGKVEKRPASAGCGGGCNQCDQGSVELYCWTEGTAPQLPPIAFGCRR